MLIYTLNNKKFRDWRVLFEMFIIIGGVADEVIAADWKSVGIGAVPISSAKQETFSIFLYFLTNQFLRKT